MEMWKYGNVSSDSYQCYKDKQILGLSCHNLIYLEPLENHPKYMLHYLGGGRTLFSGKMHQ